MIPVKRGQINSFVLISLFILFFNLRYYWLFQPINLLALIQFIKNYFLNFIIYLFINSHPNKSKQFTLFEDAHFMYTSVRRQTNKQLTNFLVQLYLFSQQRQNFVINFQLLLQLSNCWIQFYSTWTKNYIYIVILHVG